MLIAGDFPIIEGVAGNRYKKNGGKKNVAIRFHDQHRSELKIAAIPAMFGY